MGTHCTDFAMHHPLPPDSQQQHWIQQLPEGTEKPFRTGDMLSRPDCGPDQVFLLKEGSARICLSGEQKELTLGWLKAGSIYVTHSPIKPIVEKYTVHK